MHDIMKFTQLKNIKWESGRGYKSLYTPLSTPLEVGPLKSS